jgi:hypothetical protein
MRCSTVPWISARASHEAPLVTVSQTVPVSVCTRSVLNNVINTVEPGYNDVGLNDTSLMQSDILWYQLATVNHNITLLGYNNTRL